MKNQKLIIFDLDGVLIDSRDVHYESLNQALALVGKEFVISRSEHLSTFDGLGTTNAHVHEGAASRDTLRGMGKQAEVNY